MSRWTDLTTDLSNAVTSCSHPGVRYPRRLDRVKFGVKFEEVCIKNNIPGPLLVLILKLNKEGPYKKDVFRAPGHQGYTKKLVHWLQSGRLINIDTFSVYTIASVLKKFLRKIPGGIFGSSDNEESLFKIVDEEDCCTASQASQIKNLIESLPQCTQHLLVLLFGTFKVIANCSQYHNTGMSSEALGVSVAPSFFHTCVSDGKTAKMEDVLRFKVATRIMKLMIDNFNSWDLFGRSNYEFYARITGRVLKVEGQTVDPFSCLKSNAEWRARCNLESMSHQEESQSTPALLHLPDMDQSASTSLSIIPENNLLESCTRLSISLEENGLFKGSSRSSSSSTSAPRMTLEELRAVNRYAESTKSLSYLPQVHERQTARMRTRSEWFLNPQRQALSLDSDPALNILRRSDNLTSSTNLGTGLSASAESVSKRPSLKRGSSRLRRPSSRRNKENGATKSKDGVSRAPSQKGRCHGEESHHMISRTKAADNPSGVKVATQATDQAPHATLLTQHHNPRSIQITITYKPRI